MPRSLDEWRRSEATALPGWIKPQLTKLVDQAPDGPDWLHEINSTATGCTPTWTAALAGC